MPYRAPVRDYTFLLDHVLGLERLTATERFAEATPDMVDAILSGAARMAEEVLAPLNRVGDQNPARLENGIVRTPPGFAEGYRAIAEGGCLAISAPVEYGGMGLPLAVTTAVNEMIASSCLALQLNPLMAQGQIETLGHYASAEIKATYMPHLISGAWCGTMNLTEPQAGSDVGALRSKAEPRGDGTYAITGQKIYISWADNDFTENVVHLVLARLPDAPAGSKGISLFLVPKRLPDGKGGAGVANSLKVVSLEHKMGLHGSPTAVMQYDGATGWLIGEPHQGLALMFTMMNAARLGVGGQGVGIAEAAYQHALAHAQDRKQGRTPVQGGTGAILEHADVRRMLTAMKAKTFVARALTLDLAVTIDLASVTGDPAMEARAGLLTPICKAYCSDTGIWVADTGIQVHGGMGFIEETGAAQFLRDIRVSSIYEGTNGIQAMDLTGRKMMDGGAAAMALLDEIAQTAAQGPEGAGAALAEAVTRMRAATAAILAMAPNDRFAGAVPYLRAFALTLGGHYHLKAALAEPGARARLAQSYLARQLPGIGGLLAQAQLGAGDLYALSDSDLAA